MSQRREPNDTGGTPKDPAHRADTRNPDWDSYVPNGHGHTDEQIRADVHECLSAEAEGLHGSISISVAQGVVTLRGRVQDRACAKKLIDRICALESVADVRDELQIEGDQPSAVQPS